MFERLEVIRQRNDFITQELTKPEVISNVAKTTELSKEQADLSEIIDCYNEYLKAKQNLLFFVIFCIFIGIFCIFTEFRNHFNVFAVNLKGD